MTNKINPSWFGSNGAVGLYTQFRIMQFREGQHYPIATFWTDKDLTVVNADKVYFFSPALRRFKKTFVEGSFCAWLDFDEDRLPDFHLRPSLVIATGGGYHVYWRFTDFVFPEQLTFCISELFKLYPGADKMCRDVTRFMRWPGTYNLKYTPPRLATVADFSDEQYTINQIVSG